MQNKAKDFRTHKSVKNTDLNMYFYVFQGKSPHSDYQKRGLDQGTKAAVRAAQHSKTSYIAPFEQSLRRISRKGWSFQGLSVHFLSRKRTVATMNRGQRVNMAKKSKRHTGGFILKKSPEARQKISPAPRH